MDKGPIPKSHNCIYAVMSCSPHLWKPVASKFPLKHTKQKDILQKLTLDGALDEGKVKKFTHEPNVIEDRMKRDAGCEGLQYLCSTLTRHMPSGACTRDCSAQFIYSRLCWRRSLQLCHVFRHKNGRRPPCRAAA